LSGGIEKAAVEASPSVEPFVLEYEVRGFDCGYGGPLRPLSLANFLQEAAGAHASVLGIGMGELFARGHTWMLSRIDMRIDRLPKEGDRVRVVTRPSGIERLFALRDLVLEDEAGRAFVRAVYAYLVVDIEARRPLRPERALPAAPLGSPLHCIEDLAFGAAAIAVSTRPAMDVVTASSAGAAYRLVARSRHIDHNGHVNNAHIIDWLVDAALGSSDSKASGSASSGAGLGAEGFASVRSLKVDFVQEILEGEEIEASAGPSAVATIAASTRAGASAEQVSDAPVAISAALTRAGSIAAKVELGFR